MSNSPRRRCDLNFTDLPIGQPHMLLTDDHGNFWLADAEHETDAKPISVPDALDWAIKAYGESSESPEWPAALLGRAAKALQESKPNPEKKTPPGD